MKDENIEWFKAKGCKIKRIAVPKSGMVLWDSRLIHANARPIEGRKTPGRWRFVVLACMAPAIWATNNDIKKKKEAYDTVAMTTHWPCQGIHIMKAEIPSYCRKDVSMPTDHSNIRNSKTVKELCGVVPYDFYDGKSNGPDRFPGWRNNSFKHRILNNVKQTFNIWSIISFGLSILVVYLAYKFKY